MRTPPGLVLIGSLVASSSCGTGAPEPTAPTRFRERPPHATGLAFANALAPSEDLNIITYLYYFNGGGIAAGDVDGDGLVDLYVTANQGPDALFLNEGGLRFRENTAAAGLSTASDWSTGASFADVDGDGDLDLYVNKATAHAGLPEARNELYLNDGAGGFTEAAPRFGLDLRGLSTQTAFFDADADGDLDAYALRQSVHGPDRHARGEQREVPSNRYGDRLLIQGEDGVFRDESEARGIYSSRLGYGLGLAVADFDGDGHVDIAVGNDFGEHDYLYLGIGEGRYREAGDRAFESTSQFSMGSAAADLDGDGRLDLVTLDMRPARDSVRKSSSGADEPAAFALRRRLGFRPQYARNAVQLNVGAGFVDVAPMLGLHSTDWSWAPVPFDGDLDGDLDLFVANGIPRRPNDLDYLRYSADDLLQREASNLQLAGLMPPGFAANLAFAQGPDFSFADSSSAWGIATEGATTAALAIDLDGDLDEDLLTSDAGGGLRLFENTTVGPADAPPGNVLKVELRGPATNPYGVGARVEVSAEGFRRVVEAQPVTGFQSSYVGPLLVTLPSGTSAAEALVEVRWPDGSTTTSRPGPPRRSVAYDEASAAPRRRERSSWAGLPRCDGSTEAYAAFDRDPLTPFVGALSPRSRSVLDSSRIANAGREIEAWLARGVRPPRHPAALYDPHAVTDALALGDTLLVCGLWMPVLELRRGADGQVHVDTVAPPGLWLSISRIGNALAFGNIGPNTLLTERGGDLLRVFVGDYDGNGRADPILVQGEGEGAVTLFGLDALARQMPMMRKFFTRYLPFSASPFAELFGPMLDSETDLVLEARELRSMRFDLRTRSLTPLPAPAQRGALLDVSVRDAEATLRFAPITAHPEIGNPSRRPVRLPLELLLRTAS